MSKKTRELTPATASAILRSMGLISNHDNGYFEAALCAYLDHGDAAKAANDAWDEREKDRAADYD